MIKEARWSGWVWVGECFFWYRPTRVVPDQRPLNGRCCTEHIHSTGTEVALIPRYTLATTLSIGNETWERGNWERCFSQNLSGSPSNSAGTLSVRQWSISLVAASAADGCVSLICSCRSRLRLAAARLSSSPLLTGPSNTQRRSRAWSVESAIPITEQCCFDWKDHDCSIILHLSHQDQALSGLLREGFWCQGADLPIAATPNSLTVIVWGWSLFPNQKEAGFIWLLLGLYTTVPVTVVEIINVKHSIMHVSNCTKISPSLTTPQWGDSAPFPFSSVSLATWVTVTNSILIGCRVWPQYTNVGDRQTIDDRQKVDGTGLQYFWYSGDVCETKEWPKSIPNRNIRF